MKAIFKNFLNVMIILMTCSCSTTNGQVIVYRTHHQPHCYNYYNGYHVFPRTQSIYTCTRHTYEIKNICDNQPQNVTNVYVNSQTDNNERIYPVNTNNENVQKSAEYNSYDEFQNECYRRENTNPLINMSDWKVTIHFYRNSSRLERETANEINIENIKEFLEKNPNASIVMDGYSDIKTGSSEYNFRLASRRVHEVASRLLLSPYISKKQIKVNIIGDKQQVYNENKWNRCVIIYPQF